MRRADAIALALAALLPACTCHSATTEATEAIPRASATITIDGQSIEDDWARRAMRAQLLGEDGQLARPSSELRLLRDDTDLLIALYAADEQIQSTDRFELTLGARTWRLAATGGVTPSTPGLRVGVDRDGSLDDPTDDDEEWVLEVALPLSVTGLVAGTRVAASVSRCDLTKDGGTRCARWTGELGIQ